ncbi:uracil-DNA glycosylase family protein [Methylopila musalis]|uniref:Uracil-DNA glycosylase family protein n=1 Tax=Methylopila musalis TaxID=1134781 RepID=A0ABW3Z901_9HYPH
MLTGPFDCSGSADARLAGLLAEIRACRICRDRPRGAPLPHEPRPVARASLSARLAVCGQVPGVRVHASGVPFSDPSGVRLRRWMGVTDAEFYDEARVAVLPMGFCFPGQDARGADRPPRRECAPAWRTQLFEALPNVELVLAIGRPAQLWHLGPDASPSLTETVARWREILARPVLLRVLPLPHPSWRNNAWLRRHPWFESELEPALRALVRRALDSSPGPRRAGPDPA